MLYLYKMSIENIAKLIIIASSAIFALSSAGVKYVEDIPVI